MEELFYKDAYIKHFEAEVVEVIDKKYIILSQTTFYPQSGGQPHDIGVLTKDGEVYEICYVSKFNNHILHENEKHGLKKGDKIKGEINWDKRYKLMRMHTAAHVLSAVLFNETKALITGNQLSDDISRIDFSLENFNKDKIQEYINIANNYIKKDLQVKSYFISRKEADSMEQLSKLAKGLSLEIKNIRIVEIISLDKQGDGGTHVNSLKEIGLIKLERLENKGTKNRRIYFSLN